MESSVGNKLKVLFLDTEKRSCNFYIGKSICRALALHPRIGQVIRADYGSIINIALNEKFDLFLVLGGAGGEIAIIERVTKLCGVCALWTSEDPYAITANKSISNFFDFVVTNDKGSISEYKKPVTHLPFAGSEDIHYFPVIEDQKKFLYDILFIGTAWPNRIVMLHEIHQRFRAQYKMKMALPRNQFLPNVTVGSLSEIENWKTSAIDFCRMANLSRVVINLPRDFTASIDDKSIALSPPPRVFEQALAGTCQGFLTVGESLDSYFDIQNEIFCTNSITELMNSVDCILHDPDLRTAKALAAQARCVQQHLYKQRVESILDCYDAVVSTKQVEHGQALCSSISKEVTESSRIGVRRKRLLFVSHSMLNNNVGGVEVHQKELGIFLEHNGYDIYYYYPNRSQNTYNLLCPSGQEIVYPFPGTISRNFLSNSVLETIFAKVLLQFKIDIIHFQHLLDHPLSLPLVSKSLGIPSFFVVQDFFLVCDKFNLIDSFGRYCDLKFGEESKCAVCLTMSDGHAFDAQNKRRSFIRHVVQAFDRVIASTVETKRILCEIFPDLDDSKFFILPLAAKVEHILSERKKVNSFEINSTNGSKTFTKLVDEPLNILVPGNFTTQKGAHELLLVFRLLKNENIHFFIAGRVEPFFLEIFDAIKLPNVTIIGQYKLEDFWSFAKKCQVSIYFSIWPETFCLALSEGWAAGLVPLVADIGALGDRVEHGVNGFKVPSQDISQLIEFLRYLESNRNVINELKNNITPDCYIDTKNNFKTLLSKYEEIYSFYNPLLSQCNNSIQDYALTVNDLGLRIAAPDWTSEVLVVDQDADESFPCIATSLPYQFLDYPVSAKAARCCFSLQYLGNCDLNSNKTSFLSENEFFSIKLRPELQDRSLYPVSIFIKLEGKIQLYILAPNPSSVIENLWNVPYFFDNSETILSIDVPARDIIPDCYALWVVAIYEDSVEEIPLHYYVCVNSPALLLGLDPRPTYLNGFQLHSCEASLIIDSIGDFIPDTTAQILCIEPGATVPVVGWFACMTEANQGWDLLFACLTSDVTQTTRYFPCKYMDRADVRDKHSLPENSQFGFTFSFHASVVTEGSRLSFLVVRDTKITPVDTNIVMASKVKNQKEQIYTESHFTHITAVPYDPEFVQLDLCCNESICELPFLMAVNPKFPVVISGRLNFYSLKNCFHPKLYVSLLGAGLNPTAAAYIKADLQSGILEGDTVYFFSCTYPFELLRSETVELCLIVENDFQTIKFPVPLRIIRDYTATAEEDTKNPIKLCYNIDTISPINDMSCAASGSINIGQHFFVAGWAFPAHPLHLNAPVQIILRAVHGDRIYIYKTTKVQRPDVWKFYSIQTDFACGFEATIIDPDLVPGEYELFLQFRLGADYILTKTLSIITVYSHHPCI